MGCIRAFLAVVAISLVCLLTSCNLTKREPVFFLSFHQLAAGAETIPGGLIMPVRSADEAQERYVRRFPLLTSEYIYKAELLPSPDGRRHGLRVYFDDTAVGLWRDASGYHYGAEVAVIVDGFLAGYTDLPARMDENKIFDIRALWSRQEAQAIVDNVGRNYKIYNDKW